MRDGTATREKIRVEALRQFVERGVDAVSVRDIADAVGVRPSTLYVHWASKEDLVRDLFVGGYAAYGRALADLAAGAGAAPGAAPGTATECLRAMVRRICALHDDDPILFRFLLLTQHGARHTLRDRTVDPIDTVQAVIAAGMATGELAPGEPALKAAMAVGMVIQAATFRMNGRLAGPLGTWADDLASAVVAVCT